MGKLFGTDGVRGLANKELTPELALTLGKAGIYVLTKNTTAIPKVLVAADGRRSGDMLEAALSAGICSIGAEVYACGIIPTPAVAFLIKKYNLDAGVMISASHNPMQDNGIKFFNSQGFKLPDEVEAEIEAVIADKTDMPCPTGADVGVIKNCSTALDDYIEFLISTVPGLNLSGMKIAVDCANGATSAVAPRVFEKLGAEVHALHHSPDGCNINADCGSTHMENLKKYVKENNMNLGLAFDGDGDRMLAVDENGKEIDGDVIMAICSLALKEQGQLKDNGLVATVMSNQGLLAFAKNNGITLHRTAVGDSYVLQKMLQDDLSLGGEQSGHIIFRKFNTTGDGVLAGVQLLAVLKQKGQSLAQAAEIMEIFPQVLVNATVPNARKAELSTNPQIKKVQVDIESKLAEDERILVRPSGTEPLVRVMIEGRNQEMIDVWARELADVIEKSLNT